MPSVPMGSFCIWYVFPARKNGMDISCKGEPPPTKKKKGMDGWIQLRGGPHEHFPIHWAGGGPQVNILGGPHFLPFVHVVFFHWLSLGACLSWSPTCGPIYGIHTASGPLWSLSSASGGERGDVSKFWYSVHYYHPVICFPFGKFKFFSFFTRFSNFCLNDIILMMDA